MPNSLYFLSQRDGFVFIHTPWRPTPVFLPGKSNGQRSLVGYSSLGCKSWAQLSDQTTTSLIIEPGNIALVYVTTKMYVNKLYNWKYHNITGE